MNKGKIIMTITLGLVCFVLVCVMFMQFKTINEIDVISIKNLREAELKTELASWKTKQKEVKEQYDELIVKIKEYKEESISDEEAIELLNKELQQAKIMLGLTNIEGPGITVTLSDNEFVDIESFDLLQLVNELRIIGVEAISINEQRVVSTTDIVNITGGIIVVNGERLVSPYIVSAVGNQEDLYNELTRKKYGYFDTIIKSSEKTATIEKDNNIKILKYDSNMSLDYINK